MPQHSINRPPMDDDELWWLVSVLWGIDIPRKRICKNHQSPFEAFADAFFARHPLTVWKASRGFGGKTTLMGVLTLTEAAILGSHSTILGGSSAQSLRVHEVVNEGLASPGAPIGLLDGDPTRYETKFRNRGWVRALMASQRSVRGPHPQRLRLDEIDEMDLEIFDAAMGQPMNSRTVAAQTVASSTHQYPDKTMTEILTRAKEKGWPVYEWCYLETLEPHGWLSNSEMERKKVEVSKAMWDIEYDLQEPSFEGRAIDPDAVEATFNPSFGTYKGDPGAYIEIMGPQEGRDYVTGIDWAKEKDWTIIRTFDATDENWLEVAWERLGREPWPDMVERVYARYRKYGGSFAHDATGLGNVVSDLIDFPIRDIVMVGRRREVLFNEYISGIENRHFNCPRIEFMYGEHKYLRLEHLRGKGHPPDSFVAGAIAWSLRDTSGTLDVAPLVDEFATSGSAWTSV